MLKYDYLFFHNQKTEGKREKRDGGIKTEGSVRGKETEGKRQRGRDKGEETEGKDIIKN
jgi:hypothetical protein